MTCHPLFGPNRFKLGIFAANADGGLALTKVPERWPALWPEIVEVARMADQAGIEFFLPIARWKGFGGETNSRETSFETLTFAAALAGVTERIGLFATVHVPMIHPVYAAKALTTIDHASGGRAGLNIVCGWNPVEFDLFGLPMIEDRYAQGLEWVEVMERLFAGGAPFDYDGRFYQLRGVSGLPRPVQQPRPVMLNAAFSPTGRDFAARTADFLFTTFTDIGSGRAHIADMASRPKTLGVLPKAVGVLPKAVGSFPKAVGVFTTCHVVCRATRAEAEDYYAEYAVRMEDTGAVDAHMAGKQQFSASHDPDAYRLYRTRFAGGAGTYPLIGTAADIADEMVRMADAGFAGTTVSFVNFRNELPAFLTGVLPLLREAGLREAGLREI